MSDWPFDDRTDLSPDVYLAQAGTVFAAFDARTQDSGNVSFGVEAGGQRWFVKTAGDPSGPAAFLTHEGRIALLLNARRLAQAVTHPALPPLRGVVASSWGPMLVYDWVPGLLLHASATFRADPASAFHRFRHLPLKDLTAALDTIIDAHLRLSEAGWVADDFYDGSIIHDFANHRTYLIDLDSYHLGPFANDMGRMFGSDRFMAPEEYEFGAPIDERTTVFTLGRTISVFLGDGDLSRSLFRGTENQYRAMTVACSPDRRDRFQSLAELATAWRS